MSGADRITSEVPDACGQPVIAAEPEGQQVRETARQAERDYIECSRKQVVIDNALDEELPRFAEALRRLGE